MWYQTQLVSDIHQQNIVYGLYIYSKTRRFRNINKHKAQETLSCIHRKICCLPVEEVTVSCIWSLSAAKPSTHTRARFKVILFERISLSGKQEIRSKFRWYYYFITTFNLLDIFLEFIKFDSDVVVVVEYSHSMYGFRGFIKLYIQKCSLWPVE